MNPFSEKADGVDVEKKKKKKSRIEKVENVTVFNLHNIELDNTHHPPIKAQLKSSNRFTRRKISSWKDVTTTLYQSIGIKESRPSSKRDAVDAII